jgi:hypothetical protein
VDVASVCLWRAYSDTNAASIRRSDAFRADNSKKRLRDPGLAARYPDNSKKRAAPVALER